MNNDSDKADPNDVEALETRLMVALRRRGVTENTKAAVLDAMHRAEKQVAPQAPIQLRQRVISICAMIALAFSLAYFFLTGLPEREKVQMSAADDAAPPSEQNPDRVLIESISVAKLIDAATSEKLVRDSLFLESLGDETTSRQPPPENPTKTEIGERLIAIFQSKGLPISMRFDEFDSSLSVTGTMRQIQLVKAGVSRLTETAHRRVCALHLKSIGVGVFLFGDVPANGVYPRRLDELYPHYVLDAKLFTCPSKTVPGPALGAVPCCDFIYIPGSIPHDGSNPDANKRIIAYCPKGVHAPNDRIVLMGDGSVEYHAGEAMFIHRLKSTFDALNLQFDYVDPRPLTGEEVAKASDAIAGLSSRDPMQVYASAKYLRQVGHRHRPLIQKARLENQGHVGKALQVILDEVVKNADQPPYKAIREDLAKEIKVPPQEPVPEF
jgi:hypothetical protein